MRRMRTDLADNTRVIEKGHHQRPQRIRPTKNNVMYVESFSLQCVSSYLVVLIRENHLETQSRG